MGRHGLSTIFKDLIPETFDHKPDEEPTVDAHGPWLIFEQPSSWLRYTDLTLTNWVQQGRKCIKNLTKPKAPFWHPEFVFKVPVKAVRIRLSKKGGPSDGERLWDVFFAGPPGNDFTVPSNACPAGGELPLFPEFCKPLRPNARYELRLTDISNKGRPRFDERLTLRVAGVDPWTGESTVRTHSGEPRPILTKQPRLGIPPGATMLPEEFF